MENRVLFAILELVSIKAKCKTLVDGVKQRAMDGEKLNEIWESIYHDIFNSITSRRVLKLSKIIDMKFECPSPQESHIADVIHFYSALGTYLKPIENKYSYEISDPVFLSKVLFQKWIDDQDLLLNDMWRINNQDDIRTIYVVLKTRLERVIKYHDYWNGKSSVL